MLANFFSLSNGVQEIIRLSLLLLQLYELKLCSAVDHGINNGSIRSHIWAIKLQYVITNPLHHFASF